MDLSLPWKFTLDQRLFFYIRKKINMSVSNFLVILNKNPKSLERGKRRSKKNNMIQS